MKAEFGLSISRWTRAIHEHRKGQRKLAFCHLGDKNSPRTKLLLKRISDSRTIFEDLWLANLY